jgi:hypothetical protein
MQHRLLRENDRPGASPSVATLAELRKAEAECTRCPLYKIATQVVPEADKQREYRNFVADLRRASISSSSSTRRAARAEANF